MTKIEDSAGVAGRKYLRLIASIDARLFYEALGYSALRPHHWEIEPGLVLPCVLMEKTQP